MRCKNKIETYNPPSCYKVLEGRAETTKRLVGLRLKIGLPLRIGYPRGRPAKIRALCILIATIG